MLVLSLGREDPLEKWQPTPVLLPGEFHGQRSLAGYSPLDCKELDTTKHELTSLVPEQSLMLHKAMCTDSVTDP